MTIELTRKPASSTTGGEFDSAQSQTISGTKVFTGDVTISNGPVGRTSGSTIAVGYVGETKIQTATAASLTSTPTSFATLSLTAGVWVIYGKAVIGVSSSTGTGYVNASISTNSTSDDANATQIYMYYPGVMGTALGHRLPITPRYVNIASTTNYFLVAYNSGWGSFTGTLAAESFLQAVRLA